MDGGRRQNRSVDPPRTTLGVVGIASGAAIGAAAALHPLEVAVVDPVVTAVVFGLVVWCAGRARRGVLTAGAVAAALAVPLSWAALCLVGVAALDFAGLSGSRSGTTGSPRGSLRSVATDTAAGILLVLACTGLVDREFAHQSAAAAALACVIVIIGGLATLPRRARRITLGVGAVLVAVGAAASLLFAVRALDSRQRVAAAVDAVESGLDAARNGDADRAREQLRVAGSDVSAARKSLDSWWTWPARLVPIVAPNARVTVDTLVAVDDALTDLTDSVDGIGFDALSFRDGRVDLDQVAEVNMQLGAAAETLAALDDVATARSVWLVDDVTRRLDQLQERLVEVRPTLDNATAALDVLPAILGGNGAERRYLLVFATPSEARGGGGFAGNWAEVTALDGRIDLVRQGRARDLNPPVGREWSLEGQDDYLGRYDTFQVRSLWQNVTMSPDFPTVADVMSQIFPQAQGREVDGVIRLGPTAMEALLRITGPLTVEGRAAPLTAEDAVAFLTRDQYADTFTDNDARVDYLGNTVEAMFDVLTSQGVGNPVTAARFLQTAIDAGELVMWLPEPSETDLVARLGMTGALPSIDAGGDAFTVTQHNLLPNKIDAWSRRTITYDMQVDPDTGRLQGVVVVEVANTAPIDGSDVQVAGQTDLPRATMRELISLYSPHVIDSVTIDGDPVAPTVQPELGYRPSTVEITVPTGNSVRVEALLIGDNVLGPDGAYRLTIPPNPTVNRDRLTVRINTKRVFSGSVDAPVVIACRPSADGCALIPPAT